MGVINEKFETRFPGPVSIKEGPFISIAAANVANLPQYRQKGDTVKIDDGVNPAQEYWYENGIGDGDLVLKPKAVNQTYPSIAAMKADDAKILTISNLLVTGNQGGNFYYDASDTTTAEDGGIVFVTPTGKRIKRIYDGFVNVKWFGAVGNGSTDDTAAIQLAINYCKVRPGIILFFPKGSYNVTDSLNVTYAGASAGVQSEYYGFTIAGEDRFNSIIQARCANKVLLDMTGKNRMQVENISIANYTNDANIPSCMILLCRNLTNNSAGSHTFTNVSLRGYTTTTLVQSSSSEVNSWINCQFEAFSNNALTLTEQIENGITSQYINLIGHVQTGGNTQTTFTACGFIAFSFTAGNGYAIKIKGTDTTTFMSCYVKSTVSSAVILGSHSNCKFINVRDETTAARAIEVETGASMSGFEISGRLGAQIYANDNSSLTNSEIRLSFIPAASLIYSIDLFDFTDSYMGQVTNSLRIRNNARGSIIADDKLLADNVLPTANTTRPDKYVEAFSGGSIAWKRHYYNPDYFDIARFHRSELQKVRFIESNNINVTGNVTMNIDNGSSQIFRLVGNIQVINITGYGLEPNYAGGDIFIMTFVQDATGGRKVTFNATLFDAPQVYVNESPNAVTTVLFYRAGTGLKITAVNVGQKMQTGSGTPISSATPTFIGEIYIQTNTTPDTIWQAVGLTNSDWVALSTKGALAAYTADVENVAYTGNPASLAVAATNAELNALRVAYENLRAAVEDIRSKIV